MGKILLNAGPSERGWHRIETFLRCPQLYAYKYILQLPIGGREPLVRGGIGHVGIAHHYARLRATQQRQDPEAFYSPAEAMARVSTQHGDLGAQMHEVVKGAVEFHIDRFADERVQVVDVEREVRARIGWEGIKDELGNIRRFLFTARLDLVYSDVSGRIWISDHKFVSKVVAKVPRRYTLSGQFLGMQWFGHKLFGERFGGVRLNLIQTTPPYKVERPPVDPAPHMLSRLPQLVAEAEVAIERLEREKRNPWHYPAVANEISCANVYGNVCDGFDPCRWGPTEEQQEIVELQ